MASKFGCRFTEKAEADLDQILGYIAVELANPKAASDFADGLQSAIEEARTFPESGLPVENEFLANNAVRKKLIGNYLMYYLPDLEERTIFILRIVYGRRSMDEIIKQLEI